MRGEVKEEKWFLERNLLICSGVDKKRAKYKWFGAIRRGRGIGPICSVCWWVLILAWAPMLTWGQENAEVTYKVYREPRGPKSVHVVRIPRGQSPFQLTSVHAGNRAVGLTPISEQALTGNPPRRAVAAINGDFYRRDGVYAGDPRGLQIIDGEMISAPTAGSASFWIDAVGEPHAGPTASLMRMTWANGRSAPFGLNGGRKQNSMELFTAAVGSSTRTSGGRELILEPAATNGIWLPLRPNRIYQARIREVREKGNTRIPDGCMVLSIGPVLARTLPPPAPGELLTLSTELQPVLRGVKTAISGGPVLVAEGKRQRIEASEEDEDSYRASSMFERHPRSAVGWNAEAYFLVAVDGRIRTSAGMTLHELANFMIQLGCEGALNLDGGGSSTLFYEGKIRNHLCDGYERPIANGLVVLKTKPDIAQSIRPSGAPGR
jgi:hypothetical protein